MPVTGVSLLHPLHFFFDARIAFCIITIDQYIICLHDQFSLMFYRFIRLLHKLTFN